MIIFFYILSHATRPYASNRIGSWDGLACTDRQPNTGILHSLTRLLGGTPPQIQFSTRASDGFLAIDFPFSLRHHAARASLRGSLAKFLSFTSSPRERQSNTEYSILVKAAGIVDVGFCLTFFLS